MLDRLIVLPKPATGLVVRPNTGDPGAAGYTPTQTLVFFEDHVRTLVGEGYDCEPVGLGPRLQIAHIPSPIDTGRGGSQAGASTSWEQAAHQACKLRDAHCPVYDPATGCVYFAERHAVMRLGPNTGVGAGSSDGGGVVSLVAGSVWEAGAADGPGHDARFGEIVGLAADGRGNLYVAENADVFQQLRTGASGARIRKLALGACARDSGDSGGGRMGQGDGPAARGGEGMDAAAIRCTVVTLPDSAPPRGQWVGLVYDAAEDALLAATRTAVCRLHLRRDGDGSGPGNSASANGEQQLHGGSRSRAAAPNGGEAYFENGAVSAPPPAPRLELLAGDWRAQGHTDGRGSAAHFTAIYGLVAGAGGRTYVADNGHLRKLMVAQAPPSFTTTTTSQRYHGDQPWRQRGSVRTGARDNNNVSSDAGAFVTTLLHGDAQCSWRTPHMALLPSGCLAACGDLHDSSLHLLGGAFLPSDAATLSLLGSAADGCCCSFPSCRQPGCSESSGAAASLLQHLLLDPAPESAAHGGSDAGGSSGAESLGAAEAGVVVRVGGQALLAHRSLLAAHSEYFRQLLGGGFAESGAAETCLPDADPAAFAALLAYMYTGVLDVPDELLRPTAELSGRLLMRDVCGQLKRRLLASCCTPCDVVPSLLWAERHSLNELVPDLKAYFVRHRREVVAAAPEHVRQLAEGSAGLAAELLLALGAV